MSLAYFRYFPGDHLRAKIGMTHEQKGIYGDLLDISWDQDPPGSLPGDYAEIARLVGLPIKQLTAQAPIILRAWKRQGKRLVHEWLQREHARSLAYHIERSETGKKGVEAKRNKKLSLRLAEAELKPPSSSSSPSSPEQELRIGVDSPNQCGLNESTQVKDGMNQEKMVSPAQMKNPSVGFPWPWPSGVEHTVTNWFTHVFYPAYPLKRKKHRALAVFQSLQPSVPYLTEIMAFLEQEKVRWVQEERTPPLPDNFLKRKDWEHVRPIPTTVMTHELIVSDTCEGDHEGNCGYLNKGGTYPKD